MIAAEEAEQRQGDIRPTVFGFSRLLQACGLLSIANSLDTLKNDGVLVYFGAFVGTDTLIVLCLTIAWFLFLGSAMILIPAALIWVRHRWVRTLSAIILWALTATGLAALLLYGALTTWLADVTFRSIDSPDGRHRLLLVDSSVLMAGRHDVFEPSCGPIFDRRAIISTDDGYDPFGAGQFTVQWSDDSAIISYVFDYLAPETRLEVTVPLGTNGTCS